MTAIFHKKLQGKTTSDPGYYETQMKMVCVRAHFQCAQYTI